MRKRKITNYSEEFKKSPAQPAVDSDQPIRTTASELGVHVSTLHGWVKKYHPNSVCSTSVTEDESILAELKRLKKENQRLKQERDILKKAAAYFA